MTKVSRDTKADGRASDYSDDVVWKAYKRLGTTIAVDREFGMAHGWCSRRIKLMGRTAVSKVEHNRRRSPKRAIGKPNYAPVVKGRVSAPKPGTRPAPKGDEVFRYILTSAQNNTKLHDPAWNNLMALAEYYGAEMMVSRFVYDLVRNGSRQEKGGKTRTEEEIWYDPRIEPFVEDRRVRLAPGLVWCGEMNLLPTAVRPLSGLESYTGRDTGIFPHPKLAMESVASGKFEATKFNYTTGAVTQRNYIQRKAGQKAEFHHCYGGLLVEVTSKGWWVRQLNADSDGVIYDLDLRVADGVVTTGHRVEAITFGDIHVGENDPDNAAACWEGDASMLAVLQPRYIAVHDVLNFHSRNHHDAKNPHRRFERHTQGADYVEEEVSNAAIWLGGLSNRAAKDALVVVVDSNHDNALERWLREADYRDDPPNAVFFLEAQLAKYRAIRDRQSGFHMFEWAAHRVMADRLKPRIKFLRGDESFIICRDRNGGIELGMHGDKGPNGARGSALAFARMGRKATVAHTHTAGIVDGIYTAGTSSLLDLKYNSGPSSWSKSHVIAYGNGKRAVITVWGKGWRA